MYKIKLVTLVVLLFPGLVFLPGKVTAVQRPGFDPVVLSPKGRIAYRTLVKADRFAVGGVGWASQTTKTELALYELFEEPAAIDALNRLVRTASYEAGLYGLLGLHLLNKSELGWALAVYNARNDRKPENPPGLFSDFEPNADIVHVADGCLFFVRNRNEVAADIQAGRFDAKLRRPKEPVGPLRAGFKLRFDRSLF